MAFALRDRDGKSYSFVEYANDPWECLIDLRPRVDMNGEGLTSASDQTLLHRFRSGDEDAALQLYYRYAEKLFRLARRQTPDELSSRFDPEDIVQSVFRTFFRRAASGQYEAPEGDELWKLLLVMALNKVRSRGAYHRSLKRDIRKTQSLESDQSHSADRIDQDEAKNILCLSVEELIQQQPESHRGIIRMRIEGHEVQTIAEKQGRSKRTVERVLQSFRNALMTAAIVDVEDPGQ